MRVMRAGYRPQFRLLWRILGALMLVSLVPLGVLGAVLHQRIQGELEATVEQEMGLRVDNASANITAFVEEHLRVLRSTAALPDITGMRRDEQEPVLAGIQQANPEFSIVITIGPTGQDLARSDRGPSRDYRDRTYFQEAMKGAQQAYQIITSRTTGKPTLAIAVPIRQGTVVRGVLLGTLELEKVASFLKQVQVGKTGYVWLVDPENRAMAHPDQEKVKTQAAMAQHPAVAQARGGGTVTVDFAEDGKRWLAVPRVLRQGWVLVVQMEEAEALTQVDAFNRLFVSVVGAALIVVALLALLVSRSLTRPIQAMAGFVGQLAEGDLTASLALRRSDELGEMADALRNMRDNLRVHVAAVQGSAGRVAGTAGDLGVAAAVAAESRVVVTTAFERTMAEVEQVTDQQRWRLDGTKLVVVELVNAVEQIASTAGDQAAEVNRAAKVVFEVARQADVVAAGIGRVADAAHQVEESAQAARTTMAGALAGMGTTQNRVDLGAQAIRQMGVRAGAMVKLLHEIGALATQTNLLAMNAARGGPDGAAADVAAEVRRLADRSAHLAAESTDLLAAMQDGVQQAITFITEGEAAVRTGADQVRAAEWSLAQILLAVQTTMQETRNIGAAADGLLQGHKHFSHTMEMLAAVAEENSAAAEEMAAGSESVRASVQELDTLAVQNFATIQSVVPEMQSIARAMDRVVQVIGRLEAIKEELVQSTASLRA